MSTAGDVSTSGTSAPNGVTAIVVAGDGNDSHPVFGQNKALLELGGEPIIVHAIRALQGVPEIARVFVVGPADKLEPMLGKLPLKPHQTLCVLEQKQSLMENCLVGFKRSLSDEPNVEFEALREAHEDAVAFFMTGDIPFVTPRELRSFILGADMETYDYVLGLTPAKLLVPFYPVEDQPVIAASAMHSAEGIFRPANLHMIRPFSIKARELTEYVYAYRYQKKFRNAFGLLFAVSKTVGGFHAVRACSYLLRMQLAMAASLRGSHRLADFLRGGVKLRKAARTVSRLIGARFGIRRCETAGSALDIDKERDFVVARDGFERWRGMLDEG